MTVRARAVDMLGRQQVTGIPTALHELFKNAHDAYATRVDVDFFRGSSLLLLRDDGIGMTYEDFVGKWLTLGTESKMGATRVASFRPTGLEQRAITGEKGIGRLAIATIGEQVLVITRAIRDDGLQPFTCALIHWKLFELPGVNLNDIEIPVLQIPGNAFPDHTHVSELIEQSISSLNKLGKQVPANVKEKIVTDFRKIAFDPIAFVNATESGPSFHSLPGHGTHFFIRPTNPQLESEIQDEELDDISELRRTLIGFSNTMSNEEKLSTSFRDHDSKGDFKELLSSGEFFTPEDFQRADHYVEGQFDDYGHFKGLVSIYQSAPKEHSVSWQSSREKKALCGPFALKFGYLQGNKSESTVPPADWALMTERLKRIGGLYIYRDGIRILPYGRPDFDFLEFEKRRSLRASTAFFSYRRFFGTIELSREMNSNLIEKAGREGFQSNKPYKQFRNILINFFENLAIDFFRQSSEDSHFTSVRESLREKERTLKQREQMTAKLRKQFSKSIDVFFSKLTENYFARRASQIKESTVEQLSHVAAGAGPQSTSEILSLERQYRKEVSDLQKLADVRKPSGVGFGQKELSDWEAYLQARTKLDENLFHNLLSELNNEVNRTITRCELEVDKQTRATEHIEDLSKQVDAVREEFQGRIAEALDEFRDQSLQVLGAILDKPKRKIESVLKSFNDDSDQADPIDELDDTRIQWEQDIASSLKRANIESEALCAQLSELTGALKSRQSLGEDLIEAIESQSEAYKDQLDQYFEFAQVGMSLGIIQHEFSSTIKKVRESIRRLKPWADGTPDLAPVYNDIRSSFEHLDGYLNLFTPLHRRLYRSSVELSGQEIRRYIFDVFEERLESADISMEFAGGFDKVTVTVYPSTLLPVFVNLIDNAIYWLGNSSLNHKTISIRATESGFSVQNNGPAIDPRVGDLIFNFGMSTKIGGRGMGLYISREGLRKEGHDLILANYDPPTFVIAMSNKSQEEVND